MPDEKQPRVRTRRTQEARRSSRFQVHFINCHRWNYFDPWVCFHKDCKVEKLDAESGFSLILSGLSGMAWVGEAGYGMQIGSLEGSK